MLNVNGFDPISECMRKGDSFTFNLDEAGVKAGSYYSVQYEADYDCLLRKNLNGTPQIGAENEKMVQQQRNIAGSGLQARAQRNLY